MKKLYFLAIVNLLMLSSFGQTASWNYNSQTGNMGTTYSWIDCSGGTTIFASGNDDEENSFNWPFDFQFYDDIYNTSNSLSVCSNGFIRLDGTANTGYTEAQNYDLTSTATSFGQIIAVAMHDANVTGTGTYCNYLVTGTTPNRILTIEYNNLQIAYNDDRYTNVEVSFYETTNKIVLKLGTDNITATGVDMGLHSGVSGYFDKWGNLETNTNNTWIEYTIPPPVTDFSADNLTPTTAETVTFTDASTNTPTSWTWSFSPATVSYITGDANSQNPEVQFTAAGLYEVTLTAANAGGSDQEVKTDYINVSLPLAPVAEFSADDVSPAISQTVTFTDASSNTPTSWTWSVIGPFTYSFVGGTNSTSQDPQIQFTGTGTYTIELTATNGGGNDTETKTDYIIVSNQQTYTSDDTFTVPCGVTSITVEAWGGGGSTKTGNQNPHGGGGGGAYARSTFSVTPGQTYSVIVGAPGPSNNNSDDGSSRSGGDSYFDAGVNILAKGGTGGLAVTGGPGGSAASSVAVGSNTAKFSGGNGGDRHNNEGGGGGGGSAFTNANGNDGDTGDPTGTGIGGTGTGKGDNGGINSAGQRNGTDGALPGGGGGAHAEGGATYSGIGAGGQVIITWSDAEYDNSWIGGTTDWATASNWCGGVPGSSDDVFIPSGSTVIISSITSADCNNLTVESGASLTIESTSLAANGSLIVHGSSTGNVTYRRYMRAPTGVHLFGSPVAGQTVSGFISSNPTTVNSSRLWAWEEATATWPLPTGSFTSGQGYDMGSKTAAQVDFTGTIVSSASFTSSAPWESYVWNVDHYDYVFASGRDETTNWGGGGWNLLANPFTSAMDITDGAIGFLAVNDASFDPSYKAIYTYKDDGTGYEYIGAAVPGYSSSGETHIQAGQGFYVLVDGNGKVFNFNSNMREHSSVNYKSGNTEKAWPGLQLKASSGDVSGTTLIVFDNEMTAGLDPGYDIGQVTTWPDVELFTKLVEDDQDIFFSRQALPMGNYKDNVVPVGVWMAKADDLTFSAEIVPIEGYKFELEDRETGAFTDLSTDDYTVSLPEGYYGTGRFFIHASIKSGDDSHEYEELHIGAWTFYHRVYISGEVSDQALATIWDMNGRKIKEVKLKRGRNNTFKVPRSLSGIHALVVIDGNKKASKLLWF